VSRGGGKRAFLLALCLLGTLLFSALGVWQVERRAWKLDLIERVDARLRTAPVPFPPRSEWGRLDPHDIEYRRVRATGWFDWGKTTLVDALTELGPGNWVLTPLVTPEGPILVNRGFAPKGWRPPRSPTDEGGGSVIGLLRLSEPDGRFLRPNEPNKERWFSRDVAAIASARSLQGAAPFFIDADARTNAGAYPVGGLTVVKFRNTHLIYALTWFGLAVLSLVGLALVARSSSKPS